MTRPLLIIASLLVLVSLSCVTGCASQERIDQDPLIVAQQMQAMGLKGRAIIMFGTGHIGGAAFNLTGSSGFVEIEIEPDVPGE